MEYVKQGQHYIAQCHLRYWSNASGNIYRCDIKTGEIKYLSIKSAANKNNEWARELENPIFSDFEGQYPEVIKWLEARKEITNQIESFLKNLKSILYSRAPKQKRSSNRTVDALSDRPTVNAYTTSMLATMAVHNLFFRNNQSHVEIVVAQEERTFVITDNPGVLALPLTPRMCLLLPTTREDRDRKEYLYANEEFVKKVNEENIKKADRYIFSSEENHPDVMNYLKQWNK